MNTRPIRDRHVLGRVSVDTKGPPGAAMEASGLWNQHNGLAQ